MSTAMSDWRQQSACGDMDPHDFDGEYPVVVDGVTRMEQKDDDTLGRAAAVCASCPVYWDCERWANDEIRVCPEINMVAAGALYARGRREPLWVAEVAG